MKGKGPFSRGIGASCKRDPRFWIWRQQQCLYFPGVCTRRGVLHVPVCLVLAVGQNCSSKGHPFCLTLPRLYIGIPLGYRDTYMSGKNIQPFYSVTPKPSLPPQASAIVFKNMKPSHMPKGSEENLKVVCRTVGGTLSIGLHRSHSALLLHLGGKQNIYAALVEQFCFCRPREVNVT